MLNFISAFERSAFSIGTSIALSGGRSAPRTRIIRQTSRGSIDRLIAALRLARSERDDARYRVRLLERQVAHLQRDLDAYRHVSLQMAARLAAA